MQPPKGVLKNLISEFERLYENNRRREVSCVSAVSATVSHPIKSQTLPGFTSEDLFMHPFAAESFYS